MLLPGWAGVALQRRNNELELLAHSNHDIHLETLQLRIVDARYEDAPRFERGEFPEDTDLDWVWTEVVSGGRLRIGAKALTFKVYCGFEKPDFAEEGEF